MDPIDREAFSIANDMSLDPNERKARIDALYGAPVITPPAVADAMAQQSALGPNALAGGEADLFAAANRGADTGRYVPPTASDAGPSDLDRFIAQEAANPEQARLSATAAAPAPPPAAHVAPAPTAPAPGFQGVSPTAGFAGPGAATAGGPGKIQFSGGGGAPGEAAPGLQLPPSSPGRVVTVGSDTFQPGARQIQRAPSLDEENEAALSAAETEAGSAGVRGAEAELEAGQQRRVSAQAAATEKEFARQEAQREEERRRLALDLKERDYGDMQEQLARASSVKPFDANRYWSRKSVGEKIMGSIAAALGALGEGLAGIPNRAFERQLEEARLDVEEQKAEHDARVSAAGIKAKLAGTLYDEAKSRFQDDREARAAALQTTFEQIDSELARFDDKSLDPVRQAKLDEMRAATQAEIVKADEARRIAHEDVVVEQQRFDPKRQAVVGGTDPLKAMQREAEMASAYDKVHGKGAYAKGRGYKSAGPNKAGKFYVEGLGNARSFKDANDMREIQANFAEGMAAYDAAEKFIDDPAAALGAEIPLVGGRGSEKYHSASALEKTLVEAEAKRSGGVVTNSDREGAQQRLPKLTGVGGGAKEKLRNAREGFIRHYQAQVRSKITQEDIDTSGSSEREEQR